MNLTINRIPSPTYRWLGMNDTAVGVPEILPAAGVQMTTPDGVRLSRPDRDDRLHCGTGGGAQLDEWMDENAAETVRCDVPAQTAVQEPLRMELNASGSGIAAFDFCLEAGSSLTVVQRIHLPSGDGSAEEPVLALQNRYQIAESASLTLIQVQTGSGAGTVFSDMGGTCADGGSFALHQIILGARESYYGNAAVLTGRKASMTADIGYFLRGEQTLDMNYLADHTGKKTSCDMYAAGVLCDQAKKLFRGTIDFKQGAKEAVGSELEEVLLMDETAVCRTIPVILCAEEDVEGSHGASIGKLDESLMFYLESRGIDADAVYEMMARARIEAVVTRIPDEQTRTALQAYLDNGLF